MLQLIVVRKTKSANDSPIFCVPKKYVQGLLIVQDVRGLNNKTHTEKYSMKEANECISDIAEQNPEGLNNELDSLLHQDAPHNPFIDAIRGSCFNQKAADEINRIVTTTELRWEDLIPALSFAPP